MATVDKNFKVKNGLVVEGTTATVNGDDIVTANATQTISNKTTDSLSLNNGTGSGGAVYAEGDTATLVASSNLYLNTESGDIVMQPDGVAKIFDDEIATKLYVDGQIPVNTDNLSEGSTNLYYTEARVDAEIVDRLTNATLNNITITADGPDLTITAGGIDDLTAFTTDNLGEGETNLYFTNERALNATSSAYDASGAASTAESNANSYTDTALEGYTPTTNLDSAVGGYGYLKSSDLSTYATQSYVTTAVGDLVGMAPDALNTLQELAQALDNSPDTVDNLITTVGGKQDALTAGNNIDITDNTISVTGLSSSDISDFSTAALSATASAYDASGAASTAESNANSYTDTALESYTATSGLDSAIAGYGYAKTSDIPSAITDYVHTSDVGSAGGVATLDENGYVPLSELGNVPSAYITSVGTNLDVTDEQLTITDSPTFLVLDINSVSKQVAASVAVSTATTATAYSWTNYPTAKFLVSVNTSSKSQVSEVLLTTDASGNIAITEYGIVLTDVSLADISATYSSGTWHLNVTTLQSNSNVVVSGTLMVSGS